MFRLSPEPIDIAALSAELEDPECGAFVCFEGRVRNRNDGADVVGLEYEAYPALALAEGNRILGDLKREYGLIAIACVHRTGALKVGELAVWLGAIGVHRRECFEAVSKAMSRIKSTVPIWKRESYADGSDAWVRCNHGHPESASSAA
jgi:adenylyltransferase/sulfurtransferase